MNIIYIGCQLGGSVPEICVGQTLLVVAGIIIYVSKLS